MKSTILTASALLTMAYQPVALGSQCSAAFCRSPDALGVYNVVKVTSTAGLPGRNPPPPTDACVGYTDSAGYYHEPDSGCGHSVMALRQNGSLALVDLTPVAPSPDGQVRSFLLESKIFGAKCKKAIGANSAGTDLFRTGFCRAYESRALEPGDGSQVFTFFRDSEDPRGDADRASIWSALLTGGLVPIGFGSSSKTTVSDASAAPSIIKIEKIDQVSMIIRGTVYKTYLLNRVSN